MKTTLDPQAFFLGQIAESQAAKARLAADAAEMGKLVQAAQTCIQCYQNQGKILLCGNGGSAADAQHIAGELVARFRFNRPALPAIALTVDTSILTAIGNDYGYDEVYARQVEAYGRKGDILIAYSTSGNSPNVLKAVEMAKNLELTSIALTGASGGKLLDMVDLCLQAPSNDTPRIQEVHGLIGHMLCDLIEQSLFTRPA